MFGISFSELLLIFILGVIVFGPEQLPQIAKKAGKLFFTVQNILANLRQDIYNQTGLSELEKAKTDLNNIYYQIKNEINDQTPYKINTHNNISNTNNYTNQIYHTYLYYQPELDFDHQPELFDQ